MTIARLRNIICILIALVALGGLADAIYLTVQALTGETLACGGSPDCFRVLGSQYSHIGRIPVAALGTLAYFSVFTFATFAVFEYLRAQLLLKLTVTVMFLATLWFLYVQAFLLHAYCRYCLFSAAVTFLLAGLVIAMPPREA
jgi:uncharacterized membrane protein